MKNLLFIRHGESELNIQPHIVGGRSNYAELTPKGVAQARKVGQFLRHNEASPALVVSSPAVRTLQTAQYSLAEMGLEPEIYIHDGIQEMTHGVYDGGLRDEVYPPELLAEMNKAGKHAKLPDINAESMIDVGERMFSAAGEIADMIDDGETALIYGHGLAIRCLASHIEDWSRERTFKAETRNTSRSNFVMNNGELSVDYVGRADHLAS
jgi:broad specificity phosphatase PhoE